MPKIEICVDNLDSVIKANQLPIDRIELCSALALGGLSPNYGLLRQAVALSKIPLAVMIRPRAGDFLFSESDIQAMISEIELAKTVGIKHIVIGALTEQATLDIPMLSRLINVAEGLEITFHRAFDLCRDPFFALSQLIDLGCHRLLTSGQAKTAFAGRAMLQKLVEQADNRIQIMAGCGITADNVKAILTETNVPEIHFSAKGITLSRMSFNTQAVMGKQGEQDSQLEGLDVAQANQILAKIGEIRR